MKKILLSLLVTTSIFAQGGKVAKVVGELQKENKSFVNYSLFTINSNYSSELRKSVDTATIVSLSLTETNNIVDFKSDYIEITIPYDGELIPVLLYKVQLHADGYQVDSDKDQSLTVESGVHYRGIIKNDPSSLASFNFYKNQISGMVSNGKYKNLVIGKIDSPGNIDNYIIYSDGVLKLNKTLECSTIDTPVQTEPTGSAKESLTQKCVTVYFEVEYDLFVANGSDLNQTAIWMNSVFNNVQTLFNNDGISVAIKSVFIWTTPDPYNGTVATDYMAQFHQLRPVFNGDIGQLVGLDNNNLGGVAAVIGGLCSNNNYSYTDVFFSYETVPTYSPTVYLITHELGHLMGSQHTHGCYWNGNSTAIDGCGPTVNPAYAEGNCAVAAVPASTVGGTIMSYCYLIGSVGVNFANGFGPQPSARIIQRVENTDCLGTNCTDTCISLITNLNTYNITPTTALLSWTDADTAATNWEIAVVPYPFQPTATDYTIINSNPHNVIDLNPNTYYKFFIRPSCGALLKGTSKELIFATSDNFCAGRPFVDTGGSTANYGDRENWVRTVLPINYNDRIKVAFNSIDIEDGYDFLYIYNGIDTGSASLIPTGITGTTIVGPFESTATSGALTFKFISDTNTNGTGWDANFSCTTLGTDSNNYIDFSYYPNPVQNTITISSKSEIWNIDVYSIDGRLLYKEDKHQLGGSVDMSGYARGTYVFKVSFENTPVTFKVLKD